MNKVEYRKAKEEDRKQIADVIAYGFEDEFLPLTKSINKISKSFVNAIMIERFYIAIINNKIVAISSYSNNKSRSVMLRRKDCIKNLGFFKGLYMYYDCKKEFMNQLNINNNSGYIEFVAVLKEYRSLGIASNIIKYLINNTDYTEYLLDVNDSNYKAINTYKKLGFKELDYQKVRFAKLKGFNKIVKMNLYKNEAIIK